MHRARSTPTLPGFYTKMNGNGTSFNGSSSSSSSNGSNGSSTGTTGNNLNYNTTFTPVATRKDRNQQQYSKLRQSLEKNANAFERVLDNAIERNVARKEARQREADFFLEVPPVRAQLKLRGLPRTKAELYRMVQTLRAIRSEHEGRIDELNRAIVLHRSTTRRQAARIATLEVNLTERDQREKELRAETAAAKGKLWKSNSSSNRVEETHKEMKIALEQAMEIQRLEKRKFEEQLRDETHSKFIEHEKSVSKRINKAVADALQIHEKTTQSELEAKMEAKLNSSVSNAIRKQKEWMLKEEEKMLDGVKKTEAHLLADLKAASLEQHASQLAQAAKGNDQLIQELRRELSEQERKYIARIRRAEATHEKKLDTLERQNAMLQGQQKRVETLEMENAMLQSEIIELTYLNTTGYE